MSKIRRLTIWCQRIDVNAFYDFAIDEFFDYLIVSATFTYAWLKVDDLAH